MNVSKLVETAMKQPHILYATLHDIGFIKQSFDLGLSNHLEQKHSKDFWYTEPTCNGSNKLASIICELDSDQTKQLIKQLGAHGFHSWCIANGCYKSL